MNDIIILEYFTSRSNLDLKNKKIFFEAINLTKNLITSFLLNKNINKVYFLQNSNLNIINHRKISKYYTNKNNSFVSMLQKLPKKNTIFVAPEINNISSNFQQKISQFLPLLHSDIEINNIFSSKLRTIQFLKKNSIDHICLAKKKNKKKFVIKPIYGAGSSKVKISSNYNFKRTEIIQNYFSGLKGSFSMLCKDGNFVLISCNKQIVKNCGNNIIQNGIIVGALEDEREEIECLAKKICNAAKGLFGVIGVDIVKYDGRWHVLEINPRFTSSYIGLKECYGEKIIFQVTNLYLTKTLCLEKPKLIKTKEIIFK